MTRWTTIAALLSLVLAVVIFVLADGARRWYSGGFFLLLGLALLRSARRKKVQANT